MIKNIIHIFGGFLQGTGIKERSCLVYVCSRFSEHITERVGIITCKEVEAVQAVIIKPFQYFMKYCPPAVDSSNKFVGKLLIVKKVASELRYVPKYIVEADNAVKLFYYELCKAEDVNTLEQKDMYVIAAEMMLFRYTTGLIRSSRSGTRTAMSIFFILPTASSSFTATTMIPTGHLLWS